MLKTALFFISYIVAFQLQAFLQSRFTETVVSSSEMSLGFWGYLLGLLSLALLIKPVMIGLWLWQNSNRSPSGSLRLLSFAIKEGMRSVGSVLLWTLLLIIPGVIRYFQLFWVSWVVYLNPEYRLGRIDALKQSKKIWSEHKFLTIVLILVFEGFVAILIEAFGKGLWQGVLSAIGFYSLCLAAFKFYQKWQAPLEGASHDLDNGAVKSL